MEHNNETSRTYRKLINYFPNFNILRVNFPNSTDPRPSLKTAGKSLTCKSKIFQKSRLNFVVMALFYAITRIQQSCRYLHTLVHKICGRGLV